MKNNYFVIPGNKNYKKVQMVNFLFPLKGYCVGKNTEFDIKELPDNVDIYINRLLDEEGINSLDKLLESNKEKIHGIFFEDLGVLELVKEKKYPFVLTYFPMHALCSKSTCDEFLSECDKVVLSSDITIDDIKKMGDLSNIGALIYSRLPFMYSRRHLVSNYEKTYGLNESKKIKVKNKNSQDELIFDENEYGTLVYDSKVYDGRELLDIKMDFYIIDLSYDDVSDYDEWFNKYIVKKNELEGSTGFLHREMVVKLPPKEAKKW